MNKREKQRAALVERLLTHVLAAGLGRTSLRRLAAAAGTSDRMLLYYFRDKADLLEAVLVAGAAGLAARLDAALPGTQALPPAELFEYLGVLTETAEMRPFMRLWSEMSTAAGRGEEPLTGIANRIGEGFIVWAKGKLAVADPVLQGELAALLLVQIDGGALLEPIADGTITRQARQALTRLLAGYCG